MWSQLDHFDPHGCLQHKGKRVSSGFDQEIPFNFNPLIPPDNNDHMYQPTNRFALLDE